jgi:hypothetical protein
MHFYDPLQIKIWSPCSAVTTPVSTPVISNSALQCCHICSVHSNEQYVSHYESRSPLSYRSGLVDSIDVALLHLAGVNYQSFLLVSLLPFWIKISNSLLAVIPNSRHFWANFDETRIGDTAIQYTCITLSDNVQVLLILLSSRHKEGLIKICRCHLEHIMGPWMNVRELRLISTISIILHVKVLLLLSAEVWGRLLQFVLKNTDFILSASWETWSLKFNSAFVGRYLSCFLSYKHYEF